ncbi:MAG: hypothetical protein ACOVRN_09455, partial [Flavobacterium sp.]
MIIVPPAPLVIVFVLFMDPATKLPDTFSDPVNVAFVPEILVNVDAPVTFRDPATVVLESVDAPPTCNVPDNVSFVPVRVVNAVAPPTFNVPDNVSFVPVRVVNTVAP